MTRTATELALAMVEFTNRVQNQYDHVDMMNEAALLLTAMDAQLKDQGALLPIGYVSTIDVMAVNDNYGGVLGVHFELSDIHNVAVFIAEK